MTDSRKLRKWGVFPALAAIVAVGAYFRIARLGLRCLPADEMENWKVLQSGASLVSILFQGAAKPLPALPAAFMKIFLEVFNLPLTLFTFRLPGALVGILAIPFGFACGRILAGNKGGLISALLLALLPFDIQCSREAYHYVFIATGAFICLCGVMMMARDLGQDTKWKRSCYAAFAAGMLVLGFTGATSLPAAALLSGAAGIMALLKFLRKPRQVAPILLVGVIVAAAFVPQAVAMFLRVGEIQTAVGAFTAKQELWDPRGFAFIWNYAWGCKIPAVGLTVLAPAAALWILVNRRRNALHFLMMCLLPVGFVFYMIGRYIGGRPFFPRYMNAMLPIYHMILVAGLTQWPELPFAKRLKPKMVRALFILLICASAGLQLYPAWLSTRQTGTPIPYREVVKWADANLPAGTPILCDRYFTAWNEFKVNPPEKVVFMSTVPNEPLERYQQANWRGSAMNFFRNNPDAAFYEQQMYWTRIGRWEWPHQFFKRKQLFIDDVTIKLSDMGLAYRPVNPGVPRDQLARAIYYNTAEDLITRVRQEGRESLVVFGAGWGYLKTNDLRDWRVLKGEAVVDVYNLTAEKMEATLLVSGVAVGGDKRIDAGTGKEFVLKDQQLAQWTIGPVELQSGHNEVVLRDPEWGEKQAVLLVQRLDLKEF